jgi:chemotaxis methyl-accepting protein methylase
MTGAEGLEIVVDSVAELLHLRIGLRPDQTLRGRLRRSIHEEASRHGQDATSYLETLITNGAALQSLLNRITVQETGFFRHPEQFEALVRDILPMLGRPVRIWSAGCANGQEAYTLAMLLEEADTDGTVIATDLSTAALHRTTEARYLPRELSGLSPERLARHFSRSGDRWEVNKVVRDRVRTMHHNLLDPIPVEVGACQVVFCRNVLIYLSPDQVRLFLDRVADELAPTTILFVGAAETIWQATDRFRAVHLGDTFVYRRAPAGSSALSAATSGTRVARDRTPAVDPPRRRPDDTIRARKVQPSRDLPDGADARQRTRTGPVDAISVDNADTSELECVAQAAIADADYGTAVVAFRKCAYLRPHDPMAQLHLGLALEASGDEPSARRAFAVARRILQAAGPDLSQLGLEGYAAAELLRLLESKQ